MGALSGTSGCGCGCGSGSTTICPCEDQAGCAWTIDNLPGLHSIAYRVGDFGSFRKNMLVPSPIDPAGETYLEGWRPSAGTDLALQIVDWWAYVAEVLTFYTERIANEAYLGTALLPESVSRLVSLLGYRPRPGIGATATLAVLAAGPGSITLPPGFQVASKSVPGISSQTFELGQSVTITAPTSVPTPPPQDAPPITGDTAPPPNTPPGSAAPPPLTELIVRGGVLLKGKPSAISVGDRLLLVPADYSTETSTLTPAVVDVTGMVQETDPYGKVNTRVLLDGVSGFDSSAPAAGYRLQRSTITNHLITVPSGATVVTNSTLVLDSTARTIKAGDPVVIDTPGAGTGIDYGTGFDIVQVTGYSEELWYANAAPATPTTSPGSNGIPLLVAQLTVQAAAGESLSSNYGATVDSVIIRSGWKDVGTLLETPVLQTSMPGSVTLNQPPAAAVGTAVPAAIEDANGNGGLVTATPQTGNQVSLDAGGNVIPGTLQPPLRLLWDLITVSRGATVGNETLGVGDATQAGQDFKLNKSPVTYLADTASLSGTGYSSTIRLSVDGRWWTEVPMFYGHGPAENIFVTREDETGSTHVLTGDGVNGARLRTGAVVTATYRVGSGATVPPPGTLTNILSPQTNLSALRDPAPAGGGADPDPASLLSTRAPASVLTFGRAVSGDDYAVVAAQAPGVARASAVWTWDAGEQRALTVVFVGDDETAVASARAALTAEADPNRRVLVRLAYPRPIELGLTLEMAPDYVAGHVVAAARTALLSLFAPGVLDIGETLYRSRIESVCSVPGVVAIHHLRLFPQLYIYEEYVSPVSLVTFDSNGPRFSPGEGGYFVLDPDALYVNAGVEATTVV